MNTKFLPEGLLLHTNENKELTGSIKGLERALTEGRILEGIAVSCNNHMQLSVPLGEGVRGIMPKEEVCIPPSDKKEKDIAIISRVGKAVSFKILGLKKDINGNIIAILSRKAAQEECVRRYLCSLIPGDIIPARITHNEPFGSFADIGCGIISLLSIDCISVSRISHPKERLPVGTVIQSVVRSIDRATGRIYLSHKELLGSWEENAALFEIGQTVTGTVRSIEDYGIFVELTPNLAGLAEIKEGAIVGCRAAVFIKNIIPERMKIKLVLIDCYKDLSAPTLPRYFLPEDCMHLTRWVYSPSVCARTVETVFSE